MSRADLLLKAVQLGLQGDKAALTKVVESLIVEERTKQHPVIAQKLEVILKSSKGKTNTNGGQISPRGSGALLHELLPRKKFSNLILSDIVLETCQSLIEEQHQMKLLQAHNLEPRNRILLIGPPGNGKTSLAEAIAEELSVPLLVVRYESVVGKYLGDTGSNLKNLFEQVSTKRCVLFFDEFETLGKERGDEFETGEIKRVVSTLLMQIDNLPSHVVVIGATNHAELLDRAVWRRFQIRLNLPEPTLSQKILWFKKFEERIEVELKHDHGKLAENVDCVNFAEIEEFGTSVHRQYVLGLPESDMKEIVSQHLKSWADRTVLQ